MMGVVLGKFADVLDIFCPVTRRVVKLNVLGVEVVVVVEDFVAGTVEVSNTEV